MANVNTSGTYRRVQLPSSPGFDFEANRAKLKAQQDAARLRAAQTAQASMTPTGFPVSKPESVQRDFRQRIAGFLGIEKAGMGLATAGRVASGSINQTGDQEGAAIQQLDKILSTTQPGSPERKRQMDQYRRIYEGGVSTQAEIDPGSTLSNKEVIGSFSNVGLNAVAPTAFKGGLGAMALKSGAVGAGFGAAAGLNDNEDVAGIIKSTILGATVGAAIPVAGKAIGAVAGKARKAITEKLPESLMNHAIKPTLNELKKNIKTGSATLGKELLDEGVAGSPEKLLKISDKKLDLLENELQTALKTSKGQITREQLRPYFDDMVKTLQQTPGSKDAVLKVEELLVDVPETMTLSTANTIKRNLYSRLRDVAYKLDPNLSDKGEAMKVLARGLKTEIENGADSPEAIRRINRQLSIYGRLEDRVVDILARDGRNKIFSLTDTIAGSAGFVNPLAWAALLAKKGLENETALTYSAKILNKGKNIGTGKASKAVKDVTKRALYNAQ